MKDMYTDVHRKWWNERKYWKKKKNMSCKELKNKNEIIIIILKTHSSLPIKTYCVYEKNKKIKKKRQRRIVCARVIFVCLRNLVYHRIHTEIIWCERVKNKMAAKSWKQHIKFRRNIVFFVGFRLVKNMYFFSFEAKHHRKKRYCLGLLELEVINGQKNECILTVVMKVIWKCGKNNNFVSIRWRFSFHGSKQPIY